MKVLMLANEFPKCHPRQGELTGFAEKFLRGEKIHTCRLNENGHWKTGDVVSVRRWTGMPYRSKQEVVADNVTLRVVPVSFRFYFGFEYFSVELCCGVAFKNVSHNLFAFRDGLDVCDFISWFSSKEPYSMWCGSCLFFGEARYDCE